MIKSLIICKNNSTAKSIVNFVISNISDLRLIGIANNLEEGVKILKKNNPTLIFTTNDAIIKYLNQENDSLSPGIILISKQDENNPVFYKNNLLLHIDYSENFKIISEETYTFIERNYTSQKRKKAKELLTNVGFDFKLSGTIFLLDAILYISSFKGAYYFEHLKTDIYPYIARINNTTPDIIKWSISRAINYMYEKHTKETYSYAEKYFCIEYPKKPTPKLVISSLANILE